MGSVFHSLFNFRMHNHNNCVSCIKIHEISCITYSKNEFIHGVYRLFSMQPITQKAQMNRYMILESQYRLSTTPLPPCIACIGRPVTLAHRSIDRQSVRGERGCESAISCLITSVDYCRPRLPLGPFG